MPGRLRAPQAEREVKRRVATDWLKLREEYLRSPTGLNALADRHGISRGQVKSLAARQGWAAEKNAAKAAAKPGEAAPRARASPAARDPDADSQLLARYKAIGDHLTDQLARAVGELDKQVLRHKRKTRELVYGEEGPRAKPVEEKVEESCELEIVGATVSCEGLHKLSATLKNLSDLAKAGCADEQSVALVAGLMKKLDEEAAREEGPHAVPDP